MKDSPYKDEDALETLKVTTYFVVHTLNKFALAQKLGNLRIEELMREYVENKDLQYFIYLIQGDSYQKIPQGLVDFEFLEYLKTTFKDAIKEQGMEE